MKAANVIEEVSSVAEKQWQTVCREDELIENIGVCVLVNDKQIAIFKFSDGQLFAIDNYDPFSNANVLSRGVSGDLKGFPVIASPIYKQHFNLETGQCLEDESVCVPVYQVQVVNGDVQVEE